MSCTKFKQGITLLTFVSLISLFLLYRTDRLDPYFANAGPELQKSPNGGPLSNAVSDTIPGKADSARVMLSSSKVMVMIDKSTMRKMKRIIRKAEKQAKKDSAKQARYLGSSKSAIIFEPKDLVIDSVYVDSFKTKKKKQ